MPKENLRGAILLTFCVYQVFSFSAGGLKREGTKQKHSAEHIAHAASHLVLK